jgi:hypothetical protein
MKRSIFFISAFLFLLSACGVGGIDKHFQELLTDREGLFRGFNLGDSYDAILNNEDANKRTFIDSTTQRYIINYSESESYQINYFFESDLLKEIHVLAFLSSPEEAETLYTLFADFYSKMLGNPVEEKGFRVFYGPDGISIELYDESEIYNSGVLRLWIYKQGPAHPPAL